MKPDLSGAVAALLTPRFADGSIDQEGVERNLELVFSSGATGVVVCGGTGEYFDLSIDQRKLLFQQVVDAVRGRGKVICANGGARLADAVEVAEHALAIGCEALLLPPPHFFRYQQVDLQDFYREAAKRIKGPILIYNLAGFTSPLEPETTVGLLESVDNLVGVKDSSGSLATLELLQERDDLDVCRILGNDKVLVEALRRKLIDAVISGPAGIVPEIVTALFATVGRPGGKFERLGELFDEAIRRLDEMPYPYALKLLAEKRDLFKAQLPFPRGKTRTKQSEDLEDWFEDWRERLDEAL